MTAYTREKYIARCSVWKTCVFIIREILKLYLESPSSRDASYLVAAMFKGDERTRILDIYVDDVKATTWISSGMTTGFESVELGVPGQTIELRGVLGDSEWISITEVGAERAGGGARLYAYGLVLPTYGRRTCTTPEPDLPEFLCST